MRGRILIAETCPWRRAGTSAARSVLAVLGKEPPGRVKPGFMLRLETFAA